jgi:UDP-glucose 4-epimerase
MRVLVTGGAGYVGSVSVERLLEAGHEAVVLDDLSTGHREAVPDAASLEVGSYGDPDTVGRLLARARVDAILHCGARSLVGESVRDPARYYRENVAGGIVLLDAARTAGVDRIVFSSTAATYGIPATTPIPETAPLAPINPYGETKRTFEGALRFYGEAYGLRSVSLRYFNVAGATERNGEIHDPETT